ncbi:MAG TPA: N-acetylneuraminate synthase family protein [Actinomycetota bacterium]|nr:N-acetylneuraminate synthase family protein [Actinomycetota bacterium]
MREISLGGQRQIGKDHPPLLIAEIGQNHCGSISLAHLYIEEAARCGMDAVKFQTHIASAESTRDEVFRGPPPSGYEKRTRFEYWQRMEFSTQDWHELAEHVRAEGLYFLSSVFSHEAFALIETVNPDAWKIASGEVGSAGLIGRMAVTNKPILISTGMSTTADIDEALVQLDQVSASYALLQSTSLYPTPLSRVGLNVLDEWRTRYQCPVGLSDHTGTVWAPLEAMSRGVDLIEVHVILDKRITTPDTPVSLTFTEAAWLAAAREAHEELKKPLDKSNLPEDIAEIQRLFARSLALTHDCPAGTVISNSLLVEKKPGTGIPPDAKDQIVGRRLARSVRVDELLHWDDLE